MFPIDAPPKMFARACATVLTLADKLTPGWTYRGEVLDRPKHNTLVYDRVPTGNVIIFDICCAPEDYLDYEAKQTECQRLGVECVPQLFHGIVNNPDQLRQFFDVISILGGQKIEGVVIKPALNDLFDTHKKLLIGKFVSEAFKEVHTLAWKDNPDREKKQGEIIEQLAERYRSPARWNKAIQHLREAGVLENSPRDIGKLIAEVPTDIANECKDELMTLLWQWAWPRLRREVIKGLPEYYKQQLLESQFEAGEVCDTGSAVSGKGE